MWAWITKALGIAVGGSGGVGGLVKDIGGVFTENKEAAGERKHEEQMALSAQDMASLAQFAAEFHDRANRTWWDAFVDGLNRLPRPLITLGVLGVLVLVPVWPERSLEVAKVYEAMPDGFWALLSVIIAFYFGGRMQLTSGNTKVKQAGVAVVQEVVAGRKAVAQAAAAEETAKAVVVQAAAAGADVPADVLRASLPKEEEPASSLAVPAAAAVAPSGNAVVDEWRKRTGR